MITYIVGNPGSGKTYYAVYKIWEYFIKPAKESNKGNTKESKEFLYCYTNINEFKFDLDDRLVKFDFDKFYSDMENLYLLYLDKESDAVINEKAKELNLHKSFFVFDECHNFLKNKKDPVLVWWLTYHRHLYQEIYLITQDLSLVNPEYKRVAEQFLKAIDASKIFLKNKFKYTLYGSYRLYKKDQMNTISVPYLKEVFDLYHSGNTSSNKSFVRKFFTLAFIIFIITLFLVYLIVKSFSPAKAEPSLPIHAHAPNYKQETMRPIMTKPESSLNSPLQETYIYFITCILENCRIDNQSISFPRSYLLFIISSNKPIYFYSQTKQKELEALFLAFDKPVLENLKGVSNEKKSDSALPNISLFGGSSSKE